jgi:hypothetical protein
MDEQQVARQGYFAVLRWCSDPVRAECRNVAIVLIEPESGYRAVRAAPLSAVSPRLHDQGLLDAMVVQLSERLQSEPELSPDLLVEIHGTLAHSLQLTKPKPVAVVDGDDALGALYRAYLATRSSGARALTKGALLDKVVDTLRKQGEPVKRGAYIGDFIFDVVLDEPKSLSVLGVLSFASPRKDWVPVERDAGHFLYALRETSVKNATAVLQAPAENDELAWISYRRIDRWLDGADVGRTSLEQLQETQLALIS